MGAIPYISPTQLNVLIPSDLPAGSATVSIAGPNGSPVSTVYLDMDLRVVRRRASSSQISRVLQCPWVAKIGSDTWTFQEYNETATMRFPITQDRTDTKAAVDARCPGVQSSPPRPIWKY